MAMLKKVGFIVVVVLAVIALTNRVNVPFLRPASK